MIKPNYHDKHYQDNYQYTLVERAIKAKVLDYLNNIASGKFQN